MLLHAGMFIFTDMKLFDVELSLFEDAPCVTHIPLSETQGFDLGSFQDKTCFIGLYEVIFEFGFSV